MPKDSLGNSCFLLGNQKTWTLMREKLQNIFHREQFNPEKETDTAWSPVPICVWSPALRGSPPGSHLYVLGGSRSTPWSGVTPENTRESDLAHDMSCTCVSPAEHRRFGHEVRICTVLKCSERKSHFIFARRRIPSLFLSKHWLIYVLQRTGLPLWNSSSAFWDAEAGFR